MKQKSKWVAALFTAASATLAFGWCGSCDFGPSYSTTSYSSCGLAPVGERVVVYRQSCDPCGGYSYSGLAPVGQWLPIRTIREPAIMPVGERFTTTVRVVRYQPLEPIGERFVTTRVIRYQPMPVGERFTTVKVIRHHKMLQPVGESCKIVKHHKVLHKKVMLKPVGERTVIRTTTFRTPSCGCGL